MREEGTGRDSSVRGSIYPQSCYLLDFSLQRSEQRRYSTPCVRPASSKSIEIIPEHNKRRDSALGSDNGSSARYVPGVYRGTETYRHSPDETGLHLPISTPLRAQVRVLAATIGF